MYFHLVNRICLSNNNSGGKLFRIAFNSKQGLLYFNYFDTIYKGWLIDKKDKEATFSFEKLAANVDQYIVAKKIPYTGPNEKYLEYSQSLLKKSNNGNTTEIVSIKNQE